MAAPPGNKNGIGNSGGYGMPKEYRQKQIALRKKIVDEMLGVMNGKNKTAKLQLVMKLGINCVPREVELQNGGEGEFVIKIVDYGNLNSAQLRSGKQAVPAEGAEQSGAVQVPEAPPKKR